MAYVVLCANNYTNTALQVYGSINSAETFCHLLNAPVSIKLYAADATTQKFKLEMTKLATNLKNSNYTRGFVCYNGHGNSRYSSNEENGMQEYYQMIDGIVTDEDITEIFNNNIPPESVLVVISDCCSSEHDILPIVNGKPFVGDFISFGATLDPEDDMQSDLGVLTEALKANFDLLRNATTLECKNILTNWVENSWVGDLQHFSIKCSNDALWSIKPFQI